MKLIHKKVFLWGYYGSCNVGDDLLLLALLDIFSEYKNVKLQVIVANLYKEFDRFQNVNFIIQPDLTKYKFRVLKNIIFYIKTIKDNDIIIFGGGTSLFETDNIKYKSLLVKYIILLWNKIFYRRVIIHLSVGIGNVNTLIGTYCLSKILNLSDFINIRDQRSYNRALSLIKNKEKVALGCDLAYLYRFESRRHQNRYNIGISLFQYFGYISNDKSKAADFYANCKILIEELLALNPQINVHLFSFQTKKGGFDETFNLQLKNDILNDRLHLHLYSSDTLQFIKNIKLIDLCIGMRLHFLILSIINNIPIIGINYQPKIQSEFMSLGISEFCIPINDFSKITSYVRDFLDDKNTFYLKYKYAFEQVEINQRKARNIVLNLLSHYL
jgi:polysaccharide pyruvyl transferase WcaK-like protein